MSKKLYILVMAFMGGATLMSMELIFPKMSMIWFGNVLSVWSANLIMALLTIAAGYALGTVLLRKEGNHKKWLIILYSICAIFFLTMPYFQKSIFESFFEMNESIGSLITAMIFMVPTIGMLAITSPILVSELESQNEKQKTNVSTVFGVSTIAGVFGLLISGLYVIPYMGLTALMQICGVLMVLNILLAVLLNARK